MASESVSLSVKIPNGAISVTIEKTATVLRLKEKIKDQTHTATEEQKLVWKGTFPIESH